MRAALLLGLYILSTNTWAQKQMENKKIEWSTFQTADAAAITGVRWLNGKDGPVLVASSVRTGPNGPMDSTLVFSSGAGLRQELLVTHQKMPSQPDWDVASEARNGPVFIYTDSGGAVNELLLHDTRVELPVTTGKAFESFQRPRFVKHGGQLALTAIQDEKHGLMFLAPRVIDGAHHAILDCETALVVATTGDYMLVYKNELPGPARGILLAPGSLHTVGLDKKFALHGQAAEPFPGAVVYEYDADMAGGRGVILATTTAGTMLKVGDAAHGFDEPLPKEMTSPSVVVSGGKIHLAALEHAGTPHARVVTAQLPE